jgi:hypothetical protein
MSDAGWELQKAAFAALDGDAGLGALITGVYDHVPPDTGFPYVTVGEATVADESTMAKDGQAHAITVHSWSRGRGRKELKQVMGEVYRILHKSSLTVTGQDFAGMMFEFADTLIDPDGLTYHGVQRFRAVTITS